METSKKENIKEIEKRLLIIERQITDFYRPKNLRINNKKYILPSIILCCIILGILFSTAFQSSKSNISNSKYIACMPYYKNYKKAEHAYLYGGGTKKEMEEAYNLYVDCVIAHR